MSGAFAAGFALGLSLIMAIGAQNAFVLRQGLRREHVLAVVLTCAISDAVLISAGVAGFGTLAERVPWLETTMRYGGAGFLIAYGGLAFYRAWKGGESLHAADRAPTALGQVLTVCLLLTWANPHVYLDTLVLMGAVSARFDDKVSFAIGGVAASFCFFTVLGFGARLLEPLFRRPLSWRILDLGVGLVMWAIAGSLLRG